MKTEIYSHKFAQNQSVDDQSGLIRVLDGQSALPDYQRYKKRSLELLNLRPGMRCIDIGCGLGAEVHTMAEMVAPNGEAIGVDPSALFIGISEERKPKGNPARFLQADGSKLDFATASFEAARIDRVLQHTPQPSRFISEAHRMLKAGGRCVVVEPDWETFVINHPDRNNTRKIVNTWCDKYQNPWIGREISGLFKRAGFSDVLTEGVTLIYPTLEVFLRLFQFSDFARECLSDAEDWLAKLEGVGRAGEFFASVEMFMVVGKKVI
ncbi:MAG: methyltransferase domain-containing protein [Oligoflexia bacterium]|nr:methyltransferase domain-containing protein [Oligoflexia bacterium]